MPIHPQTPEERESGLICIGELYQSTDSSDAELYVRVAEDTGIRAYIFRDPSVFWRRVLRWCTKKKVVSMEEREP